MQAIPYQIKNYLVPIKLKNHKHKNNLGILTKYFHELYLLWDGP
jgi:hypothetical protein